MAKTNAYMDGRKEGLILALKIVEEGGVEALREEISFRNASDLNFRSTKKEVMKQVDDITKTVMACVKILAIAVLRDEWSFGRQRLERFEKRFEEKAVCLEDPENVTWEDYVKAIKDETGLEITFEED